MSHLPIKLLIAGGRDLNDYQLVESNIIIHLKDRQDYIIVSGCCAGADVLGESVAKLYDLYVKKFPADWGTYGKSAGPIRNSQMADYCDEAIIFWDGKSKGTKNMINNLRDRGKPHKIIFYNRGGSNG